MVKYARCAPATQPAGHITGRRRGLACRNPAPFPLRSTELAWRICDDAVQLHGGAGYMWEYPVSRALADARVPRIYGGSNEIMKELIARSCKMEL